MGVVPQSTRYPVRWQRLSGRGTRSRARPGKPNARLASSAGDRWAVVGARVTSMADCGAPIRVDVESRHEASILRVSGVLEGTTYRRLRDTIIKVAMAEPRVVIVDINNLAVPSGSAYSAFTSARWYVSVWPGVPILLVCAPPVRRHGLVRCGVARYVPVHASVGAALDAVADRS